VPLVRIDVLGWDPPALRSLGDAVHEALMETIGFPEEDRFQILTSHDGRAGLVRHGSYLDIPRDDGIVFIDITMRQGRSEEQKRALYQRVCELAGERAGVAPQNVLVVLHENTEADWSFGYGQAQYLE
jgi:phenylpyruvate tautomerase PptA (4-oxalocrotonate tautomerase family)